MILSASIRLVVAALCGFVPTSLMAAEPQAAAVSTFAPADDLVDQIGFFVGRVDEALAKKVEYDEAKQTRVKKDAHTLAVLALALGLHDKDHPRKSSAAALVKSSQALAKDFENFDLATAALANVKKAAAGEVQDPAPLKWEKVASMGALMKQVTFVNGNLSRAVNGQRFARQSAAAAAQAATLAVIAQSTVFDTHEVKDPADLEKWYQLSNEWRDAAAEINSAAHAGDQAKAAAGYKRMHKSCDACHEVFRPEVK